MAIRGTRGSRRNKGRWRSKLLQKQPRKTRCVFAQSPYSYLGSVHRSDHLENHITINLWSRPPVFLEGGGEMFPWPTWTETILPVHVMMELYLTSMIKLFLAPGVLEVYDMFWIYAVLCHGCVLVVLLNPGVSRAACLPNVDLTIFTLYAVYPQPLDYSTWCWGQQLHCPCQMKILWVQSGF